MHILIWLAAFGLPAFAYAKPSLCSSALVRHADWDKIALSRLDGRSTHDLRSFYDGILKGLAGYFDDDRIETRRHALLQRVRGMDALKLAHAYDAELKVLADAYDSAWLKSLRLAIRDESFHPYLENFVNHRQIGSKVFLAQALERAFGKDLGPAVLLMGGWYGALGSLIDQRGFDYGKIISYDIDPDSTRMAKRLNRHMVLEGKFDAITRDVFDVDYASHGPALVINTSSEHMAHFKEWYSKLPPGTKVVIQSNDYYDLPGVPGRQNGHVNCVANMEELKAQAPMSKILLEDIFPTKHYNRFMLIGIK